MIRESDDKLYVGFYIRARDQLMNVSRIRLLRLFLRFWLLGVILNLVACDQGLVEVTETDTVGKSTASSLTRLSAIPPALTGTPSKSPIPTSKLGLEADDLRGTIIHFWHTWSN